MKLSYGSRFVACLAACLAAAWLATGPKAPPLLANPDGISPRNPCTAVSPKALTSLQRTIEKSLRSAERDAAENGQNGEYAIAATNNRDLLVRSRDRVRDAASFLQSSSPASTNYAEGGKVKEHLRTTIPWLATAAHWATVSASWNVSADARASFDDTIQAIGEAHVLLGESGRCFMANYLP